MTGCRALVTTILSVAVFQTSAMAQLDEAERLIYVAKSIKKIIVRQIDKSQTEDDNKTETQKSFQIKSYDKDGKEINVSSDQANKLYKWTAKNSSGTSVDQKGVIEQMESAKDKSRKVQNVLKLVLDKGQKASNLEVRLADQFNTYSSAVGKSSIAMGKSGAGIFKSIGQWIVKHPYWSTAGAVVAVGGGIALAADGGSSSSSGGGSGSTATTGDLLVPAGTVDVTGTWTGVSTSGENPGQSVTLNLSQSGTSVSGTLQIESTVASLSGSVSGSSFSFSWTNLDGIRESDTATVVGNTMTGSGFTASR